MYKWTLHADIGMHTINMLSKISLLSKAFSWHESFWSFAIKEDLCAPKCKWQEERLGLRFTVGLQLRKEPVNSDALFCYL